jgi:transposase InsO family protein
MKPHGFLLQRKSARVVERTCDCCDRLAMGYVAATARISAEDIRDLRTITVEHRFGP